MLVQCWSTVSDAGPASNQHWFNASCLLGCVQPSKHKTFVYHLYNVGPTSNRLVQMLYRCFLFAGNSIWSCIAYCWRRLQADTDPMSIKCWASVAGAGQYPFSPSQYFMQPVPECWRYGHDALNQSWVNVGPSVCDACPHSVWRQTRHGNPIMG